VPNLLLVGWLVGALSTVVVSLSQDLFDLTFMVL
jgi:hypothetical protein